MGGIDLVTYLPVNNIISDLVCKIQVGYLRKQHSVCSEVRCKPHCLWLCFMGEEV